MQSAIDSESSVTLFARGTVEPVQCILNLFKEFRYVERVMVLRNVFGGGHNGRYGRESSGEPDVCIQAGVLDLAALECVRTNGLAVHCP